MRNLGDCRLYGILDLNYVATVDAERVSEAMIEGEVDVIQLRAKKSALTDVIDLARRLHKITSTSGVPLIVNDYAAVAAEVPVEGVHIGQDDDAIATARQKAGRQILVGRSTHSLAQADVAQSEGADYIGFGPLFATPTKPDYKPIGMTDIKPVHAQVKLPIFCIGGIKLDNLDAVIAAGAKRVAIVSGILTAPDIVKYCRACKALLTPVL